ncbi:hypothetical protein [Streptococcus sobrinus]|uniref:hypothetical protein n=1 Tax=Streptococcus sobrinus TaxID=1310 RepID=UPI00030A2F68|nr:hypothetical protein [Streptococcus sobrinus]
MQKQKKFIALAIVVFLAFLALGKYKQSTALASADVLYTTEVRDKKTGQTIKFEIQQTKKHHYRVKNTKSGQIYETKAKKEEGNYLLISLPKRQGDIVIRQGLNPFRQPTVQMENSDRYEQIEGSSTVSPAKPAEDGTTVSQDDIRKQIVSLSKDQEDKVVSDFGDWLYQSDYGKDAVVTRGKIFDNLGASATDAVFWKIKTSDDTEILTRLIGYSGGDLKDLDRPAYVDGKQGHGQDLINYKNKFKVTMLGNDLSSDAAEDFQSTASFRLYTLKDKKHKYYAKSEDEESQLLGSMNIPLEHQSMAENIGYDYFYKNFVDQSKASYQIVLATDGKVYYVKDYWFKPSKSLADYVYEEAPDDMQKAYSDAINKYASNTDNENTIESSDDGVVPANLVGTWSGKAQDVKQTMTYTKDGKVTKKVDGKTTTTTLTKVEKVSTGLYRFAAGAELASAIPSFGIGGAGFDMELGVRFNDDGSITYIEWTGPYNSDFDPETYKLTELGTFTKGNN